MPQNLCDCCPNGQHDSYREVGMCQPTHASKETPIQTLRRVATDALDILYATDDIETAQALEEALADTRMGNRVHECGCTIHHYVNDDGPHLHYCSVHSAAFELLEALKVCQVRVFMAEGSSEAYEQADRALDDALGKKVGFSVRFGVE